MNKKSLEISDMRRIKRKSYVTRVFKECTVGMVSSVAETSSKPRRFFKAFVLIVCLTGFFYQSTKFLTMVLQYPEVVDITILRPEWVIKPAYTFCDNNWMKRSLFCKKYPEYCEEADENFCETYKSYCGPNRTLVPKKEYFARQRYVSPEETIELNANLNEFLVERTPWGDLERETGPHLRYNRPFGRNVVPCYSMNNIIDTSEYPSTIGQKYFWTFPVDQLSFYVEQNETFIPGMKAGMVFAVHSPFEAVNPFDKGIFMKPGRTYMIHISMEEEVLLEKPYLTDCINYTAQWEANGRKGPRTQEMCIHKGFLEVSEECFTCIEPDILYPHKNKVCPQERVHNTSCTDEYYKEKTQNFIQSCKKNCLQMRYEYKVQERSVSKLEYDGVVPKDLDNFVFVEVYLEEKEVKVLKHMPKYMFVESFSTIGGFIGCWLGISLMEITDIFECFFRIIWYSFRRK